MIPSLHLLPCILLHILLYIYIVCILYLYIYLHRHVDNFTPILTPLRAEFSLRYLLHESLNFYLYACFNIYLYTNYVLFTTIKHFLRCLKPAKYAGSPIQLWWFSQRALRATSVSANGLEIYCTVLGLV